MVTTGTINLVKKHISEMLPAVLTKRETATLMNHVFHQTMEFAHRDGKRDLSKNMPWVQHVTSGQKVEIRKAIIRILPVPTRA